MDLTNQTPTVEAIPPDAYDLPPVADSEPAAVSQAAPRVLISLELVIYIALILLSLTLRFAELGTFPLNDQEAHEALAAYRVVDSRAAGGPLIANNPLMFAANTLLMTVVGSDTATPRLPTVLLAVLLVMSPVLFRRWVGPTNALIAAGLLAVSPVLFTTSRLMGGTVWSMALAVGGAYLVGMFIETRRAAYALAATSAALMLILMAEPAGVLTFVGLVFGVGFALVTIDDPEHRYRHILTETLGAWPWIRGLIFGAISVVVVASVFLLYPQGLGTLGNALDQLWRGFTIRPAGTPIVFPLLVSLVHEPVFWIFGLIGAYLAMKDEANFLQRALVGWLIASIVWSFLYRGADSSNALWLTLPLAGLAATTIERILAPVQDRFWQVPAWGPWVHGIAVVGMLAIAGINLLAVGQAILGTAPDQLPHLDRPLQLVMVGPAIMLVVITFFLVGSTWGTRAAWNGLGIGVLIFFGLYSLGVGWRGTILNTDDPRELWQIHPAARNLNLMEITLKTASLRATGMPYDMQLVVETPAGTRGDDGALAWVVHRYYHTEFVNELAPTLNAPVIITPATEDKPQVGAAYVGQGFPVYYIWDPGTLSWDMLIWLYDRQTRVQPDGDPRVITWVRGDIYGVPDSTNQLNVPSAQ